MKEPAMDAGMLDSPAGFASVMKGMFRDGKAKKAHAIWTSAQQKGIHDLVELRFVTHESIGYAVLAFSTTGPLDVRTRETLAAQAERFPLGTIRYESMAYSSLLPHDTNDHTIDALGDPFPDVRVFVSTTSPKGVNRPFVAHCVVDGTEYIYPVPGDRLC